MAKSAWAAESSTQARRRLPKNLKVIFWDDYPRKSPKACSSSHMNGAARAVHRKHPAFTDCRHPLHAETFSKAAQPFGKGWSGHLHLIFHHTPQHTLSSKSLAFASQITNNLNTNHSYLQKGSDMAFVEQRTNTPPDNQDRCSSDAVTRLRSEDLFRQRREVEIEHQGRIYRLRLTQLNKLILTA